ncbi:MAG: nucleotidyltransferase family protein [Pseudomonadales bacterium]|nr:nucleotidyltransferase family protein [Pseudomonadales bacterium]
MPEQTAPADIGIIILAAGSSRRFQGDKRQAVLSHGQTLLATTLSRVPETFSKKLLVLHPGDDTLAQHYARQGWQIHMAVNAAQGMGHSLASAMDCVDDWQGALIGLGDMPFITAATYAGLQNALTAHDLVVPVFKNQWGNPAGFRRGYFSAIAALRGDTGARGLLKKHQALCFHYVCNDPGVLRDIDTPDSLALAIATNPNQGTQSA